MDLLFTLVDLAARPLKLFRKNPARAAGSGLRILVIRRNRMGDMIYTLPLLHAIRKRHPTARLAVACDAAGAPIAKASGSVDEVIVLKPSWNRWIGIFKNAARLQDYDCVIAAKGGYDKRLAVLVRLTNAPQRIGFARQTGRPCRFYAHAVNPPENPHGEHQIETQLRLLAPLGIQDATPDLHLNIPPESRDRARQILQSQPFLSHPGFVLINISCNRPVKFNDEDYAALIGSLLKNTDYAVGIVCAPADRDRAQRVVLRVGRDRAAVADTPESLDLAALLQQAAFFITPEGGAAHLSAATQTPTLVLWSGHYQKWRPRGERHILVEAVDGESSIPQDRILQALAPMFHHVP
ncbi:MAG: glycosyltransferase family 9 protein [Methylacidiphilales bacterium]|nr:glycosyltransferase family 9 protein [Candidatus Methylacidiphilales bacterium]